MSISYPSVSSQPPQEAGSFLQPGVWEEDKPMAADQETPNPLDPQLKSDEKSLAKVPETFFDEGKPGEEDFKKVHAFSPTVDLDHHLFFSDVTPKRPPHNLRPRRSSSSSRKKGKRNTEKKLATEKTFRCLMEKLKPIPFMPPKILFFAKHEMLLKRLGLWDFVHIDFDGNLQLELIAQLVATYDGKQGCSFVNKCRIAVNRTNLARALKLPVKKVEGNVGGVEGLDLNAWVLSVEEVEFIEDFVPDWVFLHEDDWLMPTEVSNWIGLINDGYLDEVDWAGMFWFMVEKELTRGERLIDCYYAAHLQHLILSQHKEAFTLAEKEVLDAKMGEEEEGNNENDTEVKLTLGQNVGEKIKEMKDTEMLDAGKFKENVADQVPWIVDGKNEAAEYCVKSFSGEEDRNNLDNKKEKEETEVKPEDGFLEKVAEQGRWLLDGNNNTRETYTKSGGFEESRRDNCLDNQKENKESEEEKVEDGFHVLSGDDVPGADGPTRNLLHETAGNDIAFGSNGQLCESFSVNPTSHMQNMAIMPSFFNNVGKQVILPDDDSSLNVSNKRLRIDNSWDHKLVGFERCMEQTRKIVEMAKIMYGETEKAQQHLEINQTHLLNELQGRDELIEHLHKTKLEEIQTRDAELYRLKHELYLTSSIVDGYKKVVKETQKAFADYREKFQLPEEPLYKDAGHGCLMLSTREIETLQKKQEEEYKLNCLLVEQKKKLQLSLDPEVTALHR